MRLPGSGATSPGLRIIFRNLASCRVGGCLYRFVDELVGVVLSGCQLGWISARPARADPGGRENVTPTWIRVSLVQQWMVEGYSQTGADSPDLVERKRCGVCG